MVQLRIQTIILLELIWTVLAARQSFGFSLSSSLIKVSLVSNQPILSLNRRQRSNLLALRYTCVRSWCGKLYHQYLWPRLLLWTFGSNFRHWRRYWGKLRRWRSSADWTTRNQNGLFNRNWHYWNVGLEPSKCRQEPSKCGEQANCLASSRPHFDWLQKKVNRFCTALYTKPDMFASFLLTAWHFFIGLSINFS